MTSYEYVLGDAPAEGDRLRRQAALWDPDTFRLLERAGAGAGLRVLEIGPGAGSVHAALRRSVGAPVDAVERSPVFAQALDVAAERDGVGPGRVWRCDLIEADLPPETYDLIFARWVFCFLPDPARHVRKLASALRAGGRLVIQDYAHREAFALFPRPGAWSDFLAADRTLFSSQGGDGSIAGRMPALFASADLTMADVVPMQKSGTPGSDVWRWLWDFFLSVRDRYALVPPLTPDTTRALEREWRAAADDPRAVITAPAVVGLIAQKGPRPKGRRP